MSGKSKIQWTQETWNPLAGCSLESPGCKGCYAMRIAWRLMHNPHPDIAAKYEGTARLVKGVPVFTGRVNLDEAELLTPLRRKTPTIYFVNSMSDLFHPNVSDETIDRVFAIMAQCYERGLGHIFQVLTKRSARMRAYFEADAARKKGIRAAYDRMGLSECWLPTWPLPNVWLGVSVEDQKRADARREDFRAVPAAVRFVSYEPAIGAVDWDGWEFVQQIISGGESGPKARPSHPDWHRRTRDFCAAHGIAYFFKQWGAYAPLGPADAIEASDAAWPDGTIGPGTAATNGGLGTTLFHLTNSHAGKKWKKQAGRFLDGVEHNELPRVAA